MWLLGKKKLYNAPVHRAHTVKNYKDQNKATSMEWPAQSPDLNTIENIWLYMKRELQKSAVDIATKSDCEIQRVWHNIELEWIKYSVTTATWPTPQNMKWPYLKFWPGTYIPPPPHPTPSRASLCTTEASHYQHWLDDYLLGPIFIWQPRLGIMSKNRARLEAFIDPQGKRPNI